MGVNVRATLLSRDPSRFKAEVPHLGLRPEFDWVVGEPAGFAAPTGGFDYLIDFATPSAAEVGAAGTAIVEHCLQGSANLLSFAKTAGVRRVLYASSGAVYGRQPDNVERLTEDFATDPATVSPYGRLKQRSEALLLGSGLDCVIARGFAFIGPYLPLTDKFAAGSFLRDALAGGPIVINGDGRATRSYLHAADLTIWLLTLLTRGTPGHVCNVGSEQAVSMLELAGRISACSTPGLRVDLRGSPGAESVGNYVPNISRAKTELGLLARIPLDAAIRQTLDWHLAKHDRA